MNRWPSEKWVAEAQGIWEYVRDQNQQGRYPRSGEAALNRGIMLRLLLRDDLLRNLGSESARLLVAGEVEPRQHYKPAGVAR